MQMLTQGFSVYYSPLNFLPIRSQGKITAIRNPDEQIVQKLLKIGVQKDREITLEENFPAFVIRVNETQIQLDRNMASSITVRMTTAQEPH